jgi:hypothetical protein
VGQIRDLIEYGNGWRLIIALVEFGGDFEVYGTGVLTMYELQVAASQYPLYEYISLHISRASIKVYMHATDYCL